MVLLNLVVLCLMAFFAGKIMEFYKINRYWGLLISFYPGFLFSLARNLTEILAICLLTVAFYLFIKKRNFLAAIFASLAILARETALVFTLGFLAAYCFQIIFKKKKFNTREVLIYLLPLVVFFVWQFILGQIWPKSAVSTSIFYNISWPFAGFMYHIEHGRLINRQNYLEILYLFIIVSTAAWIAIKSKINRGVIFSFIVALDIFILISKSIWTEDWSFMRAFSDLYFFSMLIILVSTSVFRKIPIIFTIVMWFALYKIAILGWLFG